MQMMVLTLPSHWHCLKADNWWQVENCEKFNGPTSYFASQGNKLIEMFMQGLAKIDTELKDVEQKIADAAPGEK